MEGPFAYQINQGASLDTANLSSALYHVSMAKKLIADKVRFDVETKGAAKVTDLYIYLVIITMYK